ncbi:MAG: cyclic nucleotide-binding domain-containing protein [Magnetococcales bacterium]|nr:cyclic nucleotide-binding domain-containing protein [Magnetococcales bacterium]MBF0322511.1 cyclic nucleotide-binding domain-containing protein [Magnetococcales bacterium]
MHFNLNKVQDIRLFRGIERSEIDSLLQACASLTRFRPGEEIFAEGAVGSEIFILPAGRVRILLAKGTDSQKEIPIRGPDIFGEMAFLDQAPRSGTAVADESLEVYGLERVPTQKYFSLHPSLGLEIMRNLTVILARKIRRTNAILLQELRRMPGEKDGDRESDLSETTTIINPQSLALQDSLDAFARTRNSNRIVQSIVP